jgi:signal peptidase II
VQPDELAPAPARSRLGERRLDLAVAGAVVVFDQITKLIVHSRIALHESVTVIPGFLDLTHVRNTGAAFGFLNAVEFPFKPFVIPMVALLALLAIAAYAARLDARERGGRLGLALILGGAVGNLIDRTRIGYVVDFVDVYWGDYHFWAFNVADASIFVGAVVILVDMIFLNRHASQTV